MTNEQKFLGYLDSLKGSNNQKLIECVQDGFKTLVEYQVVGNMSERGVDLMENEEMNDGVPNEVVALIEKLTSEIEELRSAMQAIDDIADEHDNETYDTEEDLEVDEPEAEEEREPVEEASVLTPDGVEVNVSAEGQAAANRAYERAVDKTESGGSLSGREPQRIDDIDPRDIDAIETGQRLGKLEYGRGAVNEYGMRLDQMENGEDLPENVREGEAAGNEADEPEDHEGKMAKRQLDQISDQAESLADSFDDAEQLKAWVQAKITKAQQTIDTLYEYYRNEKGLDEESEEMEPAEEGDENPIFEK